MQIRVLHRVRFLRKWHPRHFPHQYLNRIGAKVSELNGHGTAQRRLSGCAITGSALQQVSVVGSAYRSAEYRYRQTDTDRTGHRRNHCAHSTCCRAIDPRSKPIVAGSGDVWHSTAGASGNAHRPALQISPCLHGYPMRSSASSQTSSERPSQSLSTPSQTSALHGRDRPRKQSPTGHRSRPGDPLSNIDFRVRIEQSPPTPNPSSTSPSQSSSCALQPSVAISHVRQRAPRHA